MKKVCVMLGINAIISSFFFSDAIASKDSDLAARSMVFSAYGYDEPKSAKASPTIGGTDLEKTVRNSEVFKGNLLSIIDIIEDVTGVKAQDKGWKFVREKLAFTNSVYPADSQIADGSISPEVKQLASFLCLKKINPAWVNSDTVTIHHSGFDWNTWKEKSVEKKEKIKPDTEVQKNYFQEENEFERRERSRDKKEKESHDKKEKESHDKKEKESHDKKEKGLEECVIY